MDVRRPSSSSSLFLTLMAGLFSMSTWAGPSGTGDLLNALSPEMKAEILEGADAEDVCELRILEKEFRISFQPGPPSSDPAKLKPNNQCGKNAPTPVVKISKVSDLKDRNRRWEWLRSYYGSCEYKKQLAAGLKRAANKLRNNPKYTFIKNETIDAGESCTIDSQAWKPSDTPDSFCMMADGNASTALEALYVGKSSFDCGGGVKNIQLFGAYEVFAGSDGVMDDDERRRFDRSYTKIVTGKNNYPEAGGLDADETGKYLGEDDDFDGHQIMKKSVDIMSEASLGEFGLTGNRVFIRAEPGYKESYLEEKGLTEKGSTQLASNSVVISTSSADTVLDDAQIETDMKELTEQYKKLTFNTNADHAAPGSLNAFDQLAVKTNREAILAGTYRLKRTGKALTDAQWKQDQAAYAKIQEIIQKPFYRDTKIYIHPRGVVTLANAIIVKKGMHPTAQFEIMAADSAEDHQFETFLASRIDACLGL